MIYLDFFLHLSVRTLIGIDDKFFRLAHAVISSNSKRDIEPASNVAYPPIARDKTNCDIFM